MEFVNDPSQTDSDRPDYAKMRGLVNCRDLSVTELTSGIGSEGGGCPTFLRNELCVEAEEIYPEKIGPPVINHSVPNTKVTLTPVSCAAQRNRSRRICRDEVKAAAASVKTARKEEIKAQADEPIEEEGNMYTASSVSEESDEENKGVAEVKVLSSEGVNMEDFNVFDTRCELEESDEENEGVAEVMVLTSEGVNIEDFNVFDTRSESKEGDEENEGVAEGKVLLSEGVNFEDFNVFDTRSESEESDEENDGVAEVTVLLSEGVNLEDFNVFDTHSESEESDEENEVQVLLSEVVNTEEFNVFDTRSESEESDEENEGVVEVTVLLSEGVNLEDFNMFDTHSESEESDEENEVQADIVGMLVQALWILFAAALRLIRGAKVVIEIGYFKIEMPLDALWRDD